MLEDLPRVTTHLDDTRDLLGNDVFQLYGQVLEVKVKHLNQAALNQCCYNMFGSATQLVTMSLRMGKVVNNTIMYGLVSAMDDRSTVRILQMEVNLLEQNAALWYLLENIILWTDSIWCYINYLTRVYHTVHK